MYSILVYLPDRLSFLFPPYYLEVCIVISDSSNLFQISNIHFGKRIQFKSISNLVDELSKMSHIKSGLPSFEFYRSLIMLIKNRKLGKVIRDKMFTTSINMINQWKIIIDGPTKTSCLSNSQTLYTLLIAKMQIQYYSGCFNK